ncbi:hypothetical protein HYS82_00455 [Candidatus Amesbacteria bacterium]|nr:hypothetical protein [Candidatus Amesbacteria bacterium]
MYETRPPGFKFRHELAHDYKLHHKTGESVYDWSESETDILAAGKLTEARKKMDETGDDSGYCVVLEDRERKFVVVT